MKEIENIEEFKNIIKSPNYSVVDFYATWCGPCKSISPIYETFPNIYRELNFYKIDVDKSSQICDLCKISSMPTFCIFHQGKIISKIRGDIKKLEACLDNIYEGAQFKNGNLSPVYV
jgi:thioredoxin 1